MTGGSALFVHTETFLANPQAIERAVEVRREPRKLAGMVSPLIVLSFGMGRLTLEELAQAASTVLGLQVAAIMLDAPSLAMDVRKPIDVRVARERLEE